MSSSAPLPGARRVEPAPSRRALHRHRRAQRRRRCYLAPFVREPGRVEDVCVYDAPSPEAIRKTARHNDLPVDRITQVRVLDPHMYR